MNLWQRHYLIDSLKVFSLLLFGFFFLYILIDYAFNAHSFTGKNFPVQMICEYYMCQMSKRASILIPFSLMVATLKVLTSANLGRELVALMAGGFSPKKIMAPFLLFGLACTAYLYINAEWIEPTAMHKLETIREIYFKKRNINSTPHVNTLILLDNSHLVYQRYDNASKQFYDLFWIKNPEDIYHMKSLTPDSPPTGSYVDHLVKNTDGEFISSESFEKKAFLDMQFEESSLQSALTPPWEQSLTELIKNCIKAKKSHGQTFGELLGVLNYKSAIPLSCLLVVLATAPFCFAYDRNFPIFSLYAISISGFVMFSMIMHSLAILAENNIGSPLITIWAPLILLFSIFSWKALRITG